jgi:hypothetical protein
MAMVISPEEVPIPNAVPIKIGDLYLTNIKEAQ